MHYVTVYALYDSEIYRKYRTKFYGPVMNKIYNKMML